MEKLINYDSIILDMQKLDTDQEILNDIKWMNSFGKRTTGSKGHKQFIESLEKKIGLMGFEIYRDSYAFDYWDEKKTGLYIEGEKIEISSVYPYSGETGSGGVSGQMVYTKSGRYRDIGGKIVVVEINHTKCIPIEFIMNKQGGYPEKTVVEKTDGDLVLTSVLKDPKLSRAKQMGAVAVILVWKGVSAEKVKDQYLPFTHEYIGIPALWVAGEDGGKVINAAKNKQTGTVILEAEKESECATESFYITLEGKKKEEVMIINSHTDGVNVIEENGIIGMLSMIRYLKDVQPQRTIIFAFITGHFRLPVFKGTSQATSKWLMDHPELWDGKGRHKRAVAGITVEHLGSMEWKENKSGAYLSTGNIQTEYTYIGNSKMEEIWKHAIKDRRRTRTVILRGHNKFQFGESQPLSEAGIPVIGLIPMPDYLTVNSESLEMEKFDPYLMCEQVESLLKATLMIDQLSADQIGTAKGYSYLWGNTN